MQNKTNATFNEQEKSDADKIIKRHPKQAAVSPPAKCCNQSGLGQAALVNREYSSD